MRWIVLIASLTVLAGTGTKSATGGSARLSAGCTIAEPAVRATIEARLPGAADFCELASQGLAGEVFRAPTFVTPTLWHYRDATLSCRLRYRRAPDWITIHNSLHACNWFTRQAPGWHSIQPANN